jgi:hypothetical protein
VDAVLAEARVNRSPDFLSDDIDEEICGPTFDSAERQRRPAASATASPGVADVARSGGTRVTARAARQEALMKMRERREVHRPTPVDPWRLVTRRFSADRLAEAEAMFAVANGYMGIRGTQDEGSPAHDPAFFVNGFHETWPIPYGESAFGFATTGQTIVSAPDGSVMRLFVDEEPLVLAESKLLSTSARSTCAPACSSGQLRFAPPAARSSS